MIAVYQFGWMVLEAIILWTSDDGGPLTTGGLLLFLFAAGLLMIYSGFGDWKTSRLIKDTPTETVRSMAAGRTEVEGTVRDDKQTVRPPYTDTDCVYVEAELERKDDEWNTVGHTEKVGQFYLEDGTDQVRIRADTGPRFHLLDDTHSIQKTYGSRNAVPTAVEQLLDIDSDSNSDGMLATATNAADTVTDTLSRSKRHRYTQSVLPVGTDIYVFGSAEPRDSTENISSQEPRLELRRDDSTNTFIISDRSEAAVAKHKLRDSLLMIVIGGILSSAMLYAILTWSYFPFSV